MISQIVACVASVSVQFRNKERGTRVKDRAKNGASFISRAVKTENPIPRSFFAPKPNGNACYAGYTDCDSSTFRASYSSPRMDAGKMKIVKITF